MSTSSTLSISTSFGDVPLTVQEYGSGRSILLLHGGAGPASVATLAELLADKVAARVVVPTHPGFGGTTRPEALASITALAEVYTQMLDALDLTDATLIGNSVGGWIASEVALRHPRRLGRLVAVDAVGIAVDGHPVATGLPPAQLAEYAWYDLSKAPIPDFATLPEAARTILAGNAATLSLYAGSMSDPTLLGRLAEIDVPTLVVWGEADRIVDVGYGRSFAAAIPGARFEVLPHTGHLPQMETPEAVLGVLTDFVGH